MTMKYLLVAVIFAMTIGNNYFTQLCFYGVISEIQITDLSLAGISLCLIENLIVLHCKFVVTSL